MTGRISALAAALAGLFALVLVGTGVGPTLVGAGGAVVLGVGLVCRRSGAITTGCAGLFVALLWAGATSGATGTGNAPLLVAGGGGIVLAWTVGRTSVELRGQLPGTDTRRLEATHLAGTTVLVGGAGSIALLPRALSVSPSPLGLVLVVFGAICLTTALLTG